MPCQRERYANGTMSDGWKFTTWPKRLRVLWVWTELSSDALWCAYPHSNQHHRLGLTCTQSPQGPDALSILASREQKTMVDLLLPEAPSKEKVKGLKNADCLTPSNEDVLAAALGAPARRVLMRAETLGPRTGWRDGYLTGAMGFCPPDPSASPIALAGSPGRVWSDLCERMPGIFSHHTLLKLYTDVSKAWSVAVR